MFAEAKRNHCLARAKYRGRLKVQIQAWYQCSQSEFPGLLEFQEGRRPLPCR
jgi:hypothetical protein